MSEKLSVSIEIAGIKEFGSLVDLLTEHYERLPTEVKDAMYLLARRGFAAEFTADDFEKIKGDDEYSHLIPHTEQDAHGGFMTANRITKSAVYLTKDNIEYTKKHDSLKIVMKSGREIILW